MKQFRDRYILEGVDYVGPYPVTADRQVAYIGTFNQVVSKSKELEKIGWRQLVIIDMFSPGKSLPS